MYQTMIQVSSQTDTPQKEALPDFLFWPLLILIGIVLPVCCFVFSKPSGNRRIR